MTPQNAYLKGIDELNNICKFYGQGNGVAYARSIKIEDEVSKGVLSNSELCLSEDGKNIVLGNSIVRNS